MHCAVTQVAWLKHGIDARYRRPVDGYMIYTDIYFEYCSHLSITFNKTLYEFLHMLEDESSTKGHIHIYSSVLLNPYASHGKGQPEVILE